MVGMHMSAIRVVYFCHAALLITHLAIEPLHSELGKTLQRLGLNRNNAALSQRVYEIVYILHGVRCGQAYPQPA